MSLDDTKNRLKEERTTPDSQRYSAIEITTATATLKRFQRFATCTFVGARTISLPPNPLPGQEHRVQDGAGDASTNNLTVGRNGLNINGAAADFVISTDDAEAKCVYIDDTLGWKVYL